MEDWKWYPVDPLELIPKDLLIQKIKSLRSIIKLYKSYNRELEITIEKVPKWIRSFYGAKYYSKIDNDDTK